MSNLSKQLKCFIEESTWVFAKTYAETWPHEYIVRENVDSLLFIEFVKHLRKHGYIAKFYKNDITYFDDSDMMYWTMGAPIQDTIIINRCKKDQAYEHRLANNDLPAKKI